MYKDCFSVSDDVSFGRVVDEIAAPQSKLGFKAAASLARARAKAVEGFREAGSTVDNIVVGIYLMFFFFLNFKINNFVLLSTIFLNFHYSLFNKLVLFCSALF